VTRHTTRDAPVVVLEQLRFAWQAQADTLLDIAEFSVARRERVFLRGPSGCGKTTLLNIIAAVLKPRSGLVEVDGVDLTQLTGAACDRFRADHIGLVFQQFNLLPFLSVAENVQLPCRFSALRRQRATQHGRSLMEETERLLAQMNIPAAMMHSRSVMHLSVGQQQRVAVARAMIGSPALIIADEPTSAFDSDVREAFLALLFQEVEAAGSSLLFVSHDAGLSGAFDRIVDLPQMNRASPAMVTGGV